MREIKFRCWDGDNKKMHLPEYADKDDFHILADGSVVETHEHGYERHELTSYRPDTWILMQYTGLKDENGKEIYEGDIIKEKNATIKWNQLHCCFGCYVNGNFSEELIGNAFIELGENTDYEVIGNIYESKPPMK